MKAQPTLFEGEGRRKKESEEGWAESDLRKIKSSPAKDIQSRNDSANHNQSNVSRSYRASTFLSVPSQSTITPPDTATAVHIDIKDVERRKCNVVVSGLKPINDVNDDLLFKSLCDRYFSVVPPIVKCRQLWIIVEPCLFFNFSTINELLTWVC